MTSAVARGRTALLALSIALVAATSACAAHPVSGASPPPATPAVAATPSAAPIAAVEPAQAFGGDCSKILSTAAVSTALGKDVSLANSDIDYGSDSAVPQLGGLSCYWGDPVGGGLQYLDAVVLPAAAASDPSAKPLVCATQPDKTATCYFNVVDSGYWLSAVADSAAGVGATALKTGVATLEATFAAQASATPPPAAASAPAGAWSLPADCTALDSAAGVTAASGSPTLVAQPAETESDQPDAYYAALTTSGYLGCAWASDGTVAAGDLGGFMVEFAPGAGWARQVAIPSDAVPVSIPGASAAFTTSDDSGIAVVDVFDGVNWLQVLPFGGPITVDQVTPVILALTRSLDAG